MTRRMLALTLAVALGCANTDSPPAPPAVSPAGNDPPGPW